VSASAHCQAAAAQQGNAGGGDFAPTLIGRIAANGDVVTSLAADFDFGSSSASCSLDLWILFTSTDAFVRVTTDASGSGATDERWFNPAGVSQGTPGLNENVYQLNERPDSVNIFTSVLDDSDSGVNRNNKPGGTLFTDDNQVTFFNPTNNVVYGYRLNAQANDPGASIARGDITLALTFRKAGASDLTVSFSGNVDAEAEDVS